MHLSTKDNLNALGRPMADLSKPLLITVASCVLYCMQYNAHMHFPTLSVFNPGNRLMHFPISPKDPMYDLGVLHETNACLGPGHHH